MGIGIYALAALATVTLSFRTGLNNYGDDWQRFQVEIGETGRRLDVFARDDEHLNERMKAICGTPPNNCDDVGTIAPMTAPVFGPPVNEANWHGLKTAAFTGAVWMIWFAAAMIATLIARWIIRGFKQNASSESPRDA